VFDQDAPHCFGGCVKEVGFVIPRRVFVAGESEIRFVNECGGLQRMIRTLVTQLRASHHSQFVVHEWDEPLQSLVSAGIAHFGEGAGYVSVMRTHLPGRGRS
jgi:hypothetical protein